MPNVISLTSTGMVAWEDFGTQTLGNVPIFQNFQQVTTSGTALLVGTFQGQKCVITQTTMAYDNANYLRGTFINTNKELFLQRIRNNSSSTNEQQMTWYGSYSQTGGFTIEGYVNGASNWGATRFPVSASRVIPFATWTLVQTYLSETFNEFQIRTLSNLQMINGQTSSYNTAQTFGTIQNYDLSFDTRGGAYREGQYVISKSRYVTFNGGITGMGINLLNGSTNSVLKTILLNGTTNQVDLMGILNPQYYIIQVLGTDGIELTRSSAMNVFGGDIYSYTGSTQSPPLVSIPAKIDTITFENGTSGTSGYLKWTPQINTSIYEIYQAERPFNTFNLIDRVNGTIGTYFDTTIKNQNEYWYYVTGTNNNGNSAPSQIVSAFVYDSVFNNFNNTLQTLKTQLQMNANWIQQISIGKKLVFPFQLPVVQLIPESNEDDNITIGFTGKKDEVYNIRIRIYYADVSQDGEESIKNISSYSGKVLQLLETIKQLSPYWYLSQVTSVEYGENVVENKQLKFMDIVWQSKRRVTR